MTTINRPGEPDFTSDPAPLGPLSGNHADDDGLVIDETFEEPDHGPQEYGSGPYEKAELPVTTRILSRSLTLTTDGTTFPDPIQFFSADPNRKELVIRVSSRTGADGVLSLGSDKSDVYNGNNIMPRSATAMGEWRSTQHTGAVWLYLTSLNASAVTITVDVWVTTV